ncbi:MAG: hypothetical protein JRJ85_28590, partial [Deltaproteobacteria bacterium]|nr:hypothetical protein [Deltaproteobacteria bacterium]
TLPISNFVGRGVVAAGLGYLGEHYSFAAGIMIMGALVLSGLIFIRYVKFYPGEVKTAML